MITTIKTALTPYVLGIKIAFAGALAALILTAGVRCGRSLERGAHDATKARHARVLADIADKTEKARQAYQAYRSFVEDRYAEQADRYEKDKLAAFNLGRDTALAVRRGDLQLRDHWACAAGARDVPASAPAAEPDAAADDRAEGAGRIVQAARECDVQVTGLQGLLTAIYGKP